MKGCVSEHSYRYMCMYIRAYFIYSLKINAPRPAGGGGEASAKSTAALTMALASARQASRSASVMPAWGATYLGFGGGLGKGW